MAYTKPKIVAQNNVNGSYAAGCPTHHRDGSLTNCSNCEMTRQFFFTKYGSYNYPYKLTVLFGRICPNSIFGTVYDNQCSK